MVKNEVAAPMLNPDSKMLAIKQATNVADTRALSRATSGCHSLTFLTSDKVKLIRKDAPENAKVIGNIFHRLPLASKPVSMQENAQPMDPNNLYLPMENPSLRPSERSATIDWASGMNPERNKLVPTYHMDMLITSPESSSIKLAKVLSKRVAEMIAFLFLYLSAIAPNAT